MQICPASLADLDEVVHLWHREGGPTSLPGGLPEATALLQRDADALFVARVGPRLVGTLIVGWDGWRCHLYRLVVEPPWRRTGVATRLVAAARTRARALGAQKIDALVALDNDPAITVWNRQGFVHDARDGRWSLRL